MRRALLLFACACACGRIGFPAHGDAPPDASDLGYFIGPGGSDGNPGTRAAPWLTFEHALAQLQAGDQLTLLDGDYDANGPSGALSFDCISGLASGTATAPIVVRADHPRAAHLFDATSPLYVAHCIGWDFEDLWLEGHDDPGDVVGGVVQVEYGDHLGFRGLLIARPNRFGNNNALEIGHATNVVVERSEAVDFFRCGFVTYDSAQVTFRELYANGRGALDIAGGYTSSCPGGDFGMLSYHARGGTFEDIIVENVCQTAFAVETDAPASGNTGVGDNHHFFDDIALGPGHYGFEIYSQCDTTIPCNGPDSITSNNTISSSVEIGYDTGYSLSGIANVIDHVTALGTAGNQTLVSLYDSSGNGLDATAYAHETLGDGGGSGIDSSGQTDWGVDHSNVNIAAPGMAYIPNDTHVTTSTEIDPGLGGCMVYIPPTSPMATAGPNGEPLGADIRFASQDGLPTTNRFWRADGTFAGCGAIVPGVNDDPATSCIGVHQRLNVGANGCALP